MWWQVPVRRLPRSARPSVESLVMWFRPVSLTKVLWLLWSQRETTTSPSLVRLFKPEPDASPGGHIWESTDSWTPQLQRTRPPWAQSQHGPGHSCVDVTLELNSYLILIIILDQSNQIWPEAVYCTVSWGILSQNNMAVFTLFLLHKVKIPLLLRF